MEQSDDSGLSHNVAFNQCLRWLVFQSRAGHWWVFSKDEAIDLLREGWTSAAAAVSEVNRRSPEGLEISDVFLIEDHMVRVVSFPHAREMAENHFCAIAYRPSRPGSLFRKAIPESLRYLTLEVTIDLVSGERSSILGEWTPQRTHINYGPGPSETGAAFLNAIQPILKRQAEVHALMYPPSRDH